MPEAKKPNRRRYVLSLRALMILVLVIGGGLGWKARRASLQRRAVAAIARLGGRVEYDWEFQGVRFNRRRGSSPPGPVWLRKLIGDEYFQEVAEVSLGGRFLGPSSRGGVEDAETARRRKLYDEDQLACLDGLDRIERLDLFTGLLDFPALERLERIDSLRELNLWEFAPLDRQRLDRLGRLTWLEDLHVPLLAGDDADLAFLDHLPGLRVLHVDQAPITDAGLARIARRKGLEILSLDGSKLTDAGMAHLAGLKSIRLLTLNKAAGISDVGIGYLEELEELLHLDMGGTAPTSAAIDRLVEKMPRLRMIAFSRARIEVEKIKALKLAHPDRRFMDYP